MDGDKGVTSMCFYKSAISCLILQDPWYLGHHTSMQFTKGDVIATLSCTAAHRLVQYWAVQGKTRVHGETVSWLPHPMVSTDPQALSYSSTGTLTSLAMVYTASGLPSVLKCVETLDSFSKTIILYLIV